MSNFSISSFVGGKAIVALSVNGTPTSINICSRPAGATQISILAGRSDLFLNECGVPTSTLANTDTTCIPFLALTAMANAQLFYTVQRYAGISGSLPGRGHRKSPPLDLLQRLLSMRITAKNYNHENPSFYTFLDVCQRGVWSASYHYPAPTAVQFTVKPSEP